MSSAQDSGPLMAAAATATSTAPSPSKEESGPPRTVAAMVIAAARCVRYAVYGSAALSFAKVYSGVDTACEVTGLQTERR